MSTETADYTVWYNRIWGILRVAMGSLISLIFISGAFILNDYSLLLYLFFSLMIVYLGIVRLRKPYLIYNHTSIQVIGVYGEKYKSYNWSEKDHVEIRNKRIFVNGKKLSFNAWFTNRRQYEHMLRFFSGESLPADELQD